MTRLPTASPQGPESVVKFLRKKDFILKKTLGQGACGLTVLLHDELIGSDFVCKKYVPFYESQREELFQNFLREIKLLHEIHHANVVRVFNYYIYPDQLTGYILMEYIDGTDIYSHLRQMPERINELFIQAIDGFCYLESAKILHGDIRPQNVLIRTDGTLKIIDLGFGKRVENENDFDKSISLNWWCEPPADFDDKIYDHTTEVYFVGKLFEKMLQDFSITNFKFHSLLAHMCERDPSNRMAGFFEAKTCLHLNQQQDINFTDEERYIYLEFAQSLSKQITKIKAGAQYNDDIEAIRTKLENAYRSCMLESELPDSALALRPFIHGTFYRRKSGFQTATLKRFLDFLRTASPEKRRVAIANLHARLDAIERYSAWDNDDMPF